MKSTVTIFTAKNTSRMEISINEGAKGKSTLGSEDYITLPVNSAEPLFFELGDWCDLSETQIEGLGDFAKRYVLVTLPSPTYNESSGEYHYDLRFDAYYYAWNRKLFKYTPDTGGAEASWSLTATLDVHMRVFKKNLDNYGYKFINTDGTEEDFEVVIDTENINTEAKLITYSSAYLIDALTTMAQTFECEWWIKGKKICFGKCEDGEEVPLSFGTEISNMTRNDSKGVHATRVYVFGAEKNLPRTYRKELFFEVKTMKTASDGRIVISDTLRPLDKAYFPTSAYRYSTEDDYKVNISYTPAMISVGRTETRSFTSARGNMIPKGKFSVDTSEITCYVQGKGNINTFDFKLTMIADNMRKVISEGSVYVYSQFASIPLNIATKANFELEATSEVYFVLDLTCNMITARDSHPVLVMSGNFIIARTGRVPRITTPLTFQTGAEKGKLIPSWINAECKSDETNTIYLPQGTNVAIGDKFTLGNIIKKKVPSTLFTSSISNNDTVTGVVQTRLMLPKGTDFIDAYKYKDGEKVYIGEEAYNDETAQLMPTDEAIEAVVTTDEIYPRIKSPITEVVEFKQNITVDDGEGEKETGQTQPIYAIATDGFDFDEEYRLVGDLQVKFTSGSLNGMTFTTEYHPKGYLYPYMMPDGTSPQPTTHDTFEIIANEDYGRRLPDTILKPRVNAEGNKQEFVLLGWDSTSIEDLGLVAKAEQELKEYGEKQVKEMLIDDGTYNATLASHWVYENLALRTFLIGRKVSLGNPAYFPSERKSRIIGVEINLDMPYDAPVYSIGESIEYSFRKDVEEKLSEVSHDGDTYQTGTTTVVGGGNGVSVSGSGGGNVVTNITQNNGTLNVEKNLTISAISLADVQAMCDDIYK